jgi:hypothetical protein
VSIPQLCSLTPREGQAGGQAAGGFKISKAAPDARILRLSQGEPADHKAAGGEPMRRC